MKQKSPPLKRRTNLIYNLRKKGVKCNTRKRTIFYPYRENPNEILQIKQLREEFNFTVQFEFNKKIYDNNRRVET